MIPALEHAGVISDYLSEELRLGHIEVIGSVEQAKKLRVHISPFGVIPKKSKPNSWRLILVLTAPHGVTASRKS